MDRMDDLDGQPAGEPLPSLRWRTRQEGTESPAINVSSPTPQLPPYLVAGNRFASAGLICGLLGLLCSLVSFLRALGWMSAVLGVLLSSIGFIKYCRGGATNRNEAVVGGLLAWIGLVILLTRLSVELQIPMPS